MGIFKDICALLLFKLYYFWLAILLQWKICTYNMSMHNIKVGELNLIQERDRYFKFALRVE